MSSEKPIRVSICGCGAISELMYVPALKCLEALGRATPVAVFDPNPERRTAVAKHFPNVASHGSFEEFCAAPSDLMVVASPASFHAQQAIAALQSGKHVLCEKPMALNVRQAAEMNTAARSAKRLLAVGHFRRFFPALESIRDLLRGGALGSVRSFDFSEGSSFQWAAQSESFFKKELAGGGVLIDAGPHVLDILLSWFGTPEAVRYFDDAAGGVEANCRIDMTYGGFNGVVRLSRDVELANRYVIQCEKGTISWTPGESKHFELRLAASARVGRVEVSSQHPSGTRVAGASYDQAFLLQLANVIDAIHGRESLRVSGEEASKTVEL
ncbi:MAG TPA: Gfo/Idh/MocA family oxidoreductase, partial [Planctomycetota bacterium]|nr:Gfo/Idh/MocA family oxidoreductase [Planctomycetota bacterium]